jgi:hypothetical protein
LSLLFEWMEHATVGIAVDRKPIRTKLGCSTV